MHVDSVAHTRAQLRLPEGLRAALDTLGASEATRHAAVDLWQRSNPGIDGRGLVLSSAAQGAMVFGALTAGAAADALVDQGLLEVDVATDELTSWKWLVDDSPTERGAKIQVGTFAAVSAEERADLAGRVVAR